MPKRTHAQIRKDAVEEVRLKDAEKNKKVIRAVISAPAKKKAPRASYKNPKPREVEVPCCLDKSRPLPQVFKVCPDCPKMTEAGSMGQAVTQTTEVGSSPRRGVKKNQASSKPRRS